MSDRFLYREVSDIPDFISQVLMLRREWFPNAQAPEMWFRGSSDLSRPLLPGAYWRTRCDEWSLVLSFKNMVPSYLTKEPRDEWDWYYFMQHYGLPTRLLDWSESPLVALFFALRQSEKDPPVAPCVWALDPAVLNEIAQSFEGEPVVIPTDLEGYGSRYWLPEFCGRGKSPTDLTHMKGWKDNSKPLAIFPKRFEPRIVAQVGVFTVHGVDEVSIEDLIVKCEDPDRRRIARFCFNPDRVHEYLRDLDCMGLTEAAMFPEPSSVALDLRRRYEVDC